MQKAVIIVPLRNPRKTRTGSSAPPKRLTSSFVVWSRASVLFALRGYKLLISPFLPSACRFSPTCSEYMLEAVAKHGVAKGIWMGIKRLGRCHPFHAGGYDPVR